MQLAHGLHLAYCTNIHRGETWAETWDALQQHTLAVRDRVAPNQPYAIGLRLSQRAASELGDPATLRAFRRWLDQHGCYVFTINGFPYGAFHGTRVKEQVYAPDWTAPERLAFTNRLFDLLAELVPPGIEGSVSTVPGSFKAFIRGDDQVRRMREQLWACIDHIDTLQRRSAKTLHLGLEPEPLCWLETSQETVEFFDAMRRDRPGDDRLAQCLGVTYDTCHLAVEFEEPAAALQRFHDHGVRASKLHLSSALKVRPTHAVRDALRAFADPVYLHQVIERTAGGALVRYPDLDEALAAAACREASEAGTAEPPEWRIHFHVPLHCQPTPLFDTTADHLLGVLDHLALRPGWCTHLEMETYTWEVMPPAFKNRGVVEQLAGEYAWTLAQLGARGFHPT